MSPTFLSPTENGIVSFRFVAIQRVLLQRTTNKKINFCDVVELVVGQAWKVALLMHDLHFAALYT